MILLGGCQFKKYNKTHRGLSFKSIQINFPIISSPERGVWSHHSPEQQFLQQQADLAKLSFSLHLIYSQFKIPCSKKYKIWCDQNDIEDEFYFISRCPLYIDIGTRYIKHFTMQNPVFSNWSSRHLLKTKQKKKNKRTWQSRESTNRKIKKYNSVISVSKICVI